MDSKSGSLTNETSVRPEFVRGKFRSELRTTIPKLNGNDIEWIVSAFVTEIDAAYAAGMARMREMAKLCPRCLEDDWPLEGNYHVRKWSDGQSRVLCGAAPGAEGEKK